MSQSSPPPAVNPEAKADSSAGPASELNPSSTQRSAPRPTLREAPFARSIDLPGVLELFAQFLRTPLGRERLEKLAFLQERELLEREQRLVREALALASCRSLPAFTEIADPRPALARAALAGLVLSAEELLLVVAFAERMGELRQTLLHPPVELKSKLPELTALAERLPVLEEALRAIRGKLLPNGELDDHASPNLFRLRRELERQKRAIEVSLQQHARRLGTEGVLQEELITIRGERFVLPVKAELRRRVPGVIHGASNSGQTVFVEPLETIELNNELIRLLDEEQAEEQRIFAGITRLLHQHAPALSLGAVLYGELEFQLAKGRFAQAYEATHATFSAESERCFDLREARHPLLVATLREQGRRVVPLTLRLREQHILVMSGPNTGGKTVVLKTVAMAACMAHCGLPVCASAAEVPVLDALLADVGDAQSLRESLSTFSSHIVNLRSLLEQATAGSLLVLDELGAATDPSEGAALAMAITEQLRQLGCFALISTHHGAMKQYAATQAGVLNASVGFDAETLRPTYAFRTGVAGVSAGLDMAAQLGLQGEIIAAARSLLTDAERRGHEYLRTLQQQSAEVEELQRTLVLERGELRLKMQELEGEERQQQRRKVRELEARFERFTQEFEQRLREAVATIEDKALRMKLEREVQLRSAGLRREASAGFQNDVLQTVTAPPAGSAPPARPVDSVQQGERVRLRDFDRPALVRRRDGERLEVEAGNLRLRVTLKDVLEILPGNTPVGKAPSAGIRVETQPVEGSGLREINLIGQTVEEALPRLEKFLDNALLAELPRVRIVHGTGMGVLRRMVQETLRAHPQVERYFSPPQAEGGNGVTIAEMKA